MRSLYALKYWYTRRLGFLIQGSVRRGISPDAWTAAGVLAATAGCGAIIMGWWPLALILMAARLAGANLDGAVARARGVARPFGYVLNELGDRVSDLLIMAGLVGLAARTAQPGALILTLVAATAATLPTFISLAAAGAGAPRLNGGPLGKTERCLAAVIACALPQYLSIIAWVIIVGSVLTAALRLARTARSLAGRTGPAPADRAAPPPPEDITRIGAGPAPGPQAGSEASTADSTADETASDPPSAPKAGRPVRRAVGGRPQTGADR